MTSPITPEDLSELIAQYTSRKKLAEDAYAKGFRNGTATLSDYNKRLLDENIAFFNEKASLAAENAALIARGDGMTTLPIKINKRVEVVCQGKHTYYNVEVINGVVQNLIIKGEDL